MHENEVAIETKQSVTSAVIEKMTELLNKLPPPQQRTVQQRVIEGTASLIIELCNQIQELESEVR
jgi:DNA-directed RNA polymerase specialized sigma24 family protein